MKKLTWNELLKLAREHYNEGGDGIVECWTEADYNEIGHMTKAEALDMFGDRDEIIRDMEADADSYREEAIQQQEAQQETDWTDYDADDMSEWRPGDAPWDAPGMSISDFIR